MNRPARACPTATRLTSGPNGAPRRRELEKGMAQGNFGVVDDFHHQQVAVKKIPATPPGFSSNLAPAGCGLGPIGDGQGVQTNRRGLVYLMTLRSESLSVRAVPDRLSSAL